jgi:hypothetical protein
LVRLNNPVIPVDKLENLYHTRRTDSQDGRHSALHICM